MFTGFESKLVIYIFIQTNVELFLKNDCFLLQFENTVKALGTVFVTLKKPAPFRNPFNYYALYPGGTLTSDPSSCTVLVTDKVRRTVKFLCAIGRGIPIVSEQWLVACKAAKIFLGNGILSQLLILKQVIKCYII
jgi:hypothetical protein